MEWLLALVLKPFIAVAMLLIAFVIAGLIHRWLPEGKLKRILFSPLPGQRSRWR